MMNLLQSKSLIISYIRVNKSFLREASASFNLFLITLLHKLDGEEDMLSRPFIAVIFSMIGTASVAPLKDTTDFAKAIEVSPITVTTLPKYEGKVRVVDNSQDEKTAPNIL